MRKAPPGSARLVGAYYELEKDVDGEWRSYYRTSPDNWRFKTPVIELGARLKRSSGTSARGAIPITSPRGAGTDEVLCARGLRRLLTAEFAIV
jgi:hypothetical protein